MDVNAASSLGFVAAWKARGFNCLLGARDPSSHLHRTALLTRGALQPVHLSVPAGPARFSAGLVDAFCGDCARRVLVVSFYGHPGDVCLTGLILGQLMQEIRSFGGPFLLLGDYNCSIDEGPVASILATGQARCLDEDLPGPLPSTNPRNTRRIDFALVHRSLFATGGNTVRREDFSDHGIVSYELGLQIHPCAYHCPRFLELHVADPAIIAAALATEWDEGRFAALLRDGSVDDAWQYLSDIAEDAMDGRCSPGSVRRSALWDPIKRQPPNHRCGPEGHQSETLRALGRLKSRLRQLRDQPSPALRAKIGRVLSHLRGKLQGLPFVNLDDPVPAIEFVDGLYDQFAAQEKAARIQVWQEDHFRSSRACVAWIKRRCRVASLAEQDPCPLQSPPRAIHPAEVVRDQSVQWTNKWNPVRPVVPQHVESLLCNFRPLPACEDQIHITGPQLIRANNKMMGKAPGPDGWTPELLALLPELWWDAAARCWNRCIQTGHFPKQWRRATVALLHKRKDETRPIALCSVIWRAGARSIAAGLRKWCESWCHHGALGAAPGRSTSCAHARLKLARAQGATAFVQQDLSSFFDSMDVTAVCLLLRRFSAPPSLCTILQAFYAEPSRVFRIGQWHSSCWTSCTRGFLQGCPLSPMVSLLIGAAWSLYTNGSRDAQGFLSLDPAATDNLIFVDDRVLWPTQHAASPLLAVREALARSDAFDAAFCFQCKPSKCAVAACPGVHTLANLALQRGYKQVQCLEVLGVSFDLASDQSSPLRLSLQGLLRKLRLLRNLNPCLEVKRLVLQSLVHAALFWATQTPGWIQKLEAHSTSNFRYDFARRLQNIEALPFL